MLAARPAFFGDATLAAFEGSWVVEMVRPYKEGCGRVSVQGAEVLRMEIAAMGGAASAGHGGSAGGAPPCGGTLGGGGGSGESLRALVHVMPEDTDGSYSISLMRLVGDTFEFHALYRSLRERLNDITVPTNGGGGTSRRPLALAALGVGGGGAGGAGASL